MGMFFSKEHSFMAERIDVHFFKIPLFHASSAEAEVLLSAIVTESGEYFIDLNPLFKSMPQPLLK